MDSPVYTLYFLFAKCCDTYFTRLAQGEKTRGNLVVTECNAYGFDTLIKHQSDNQGYL